MLVVSLDARVDPTVWAVLVVVVDVVDEQTAELVVVPDDGAIEELVTECADPPVRVCVCLSGSWRGPCRGDPRACEDVVEGSGELSGAVAEQEPEPVTVTEVHHDQVAGGLVGPRLGGVGGDPGKVHPPGLRLDHEQDAESAEQGGVDAGEVGGDDAGCLGADELEPGWSGPMTGGVDSTGAEDLPHGRRCQLVAEPDEFAVDAPIAPVRVLAGELDDQLPELGVDRWPRLRFAAGGWAQRRATRRRCQPITVAGFTIRNTSARRRRSNTAESMARIVRSAGLNWARLIWRCSTRTWWRKARISASR